MSKKFLITGGAGFIGSNYARRRVLGGDDVTIFDNLSRHGAESNLKWIESEVGGRSFQFIKGDIRDFESLKGAVEGKQVIVHLAAQVAVTSSVTDPRFDFDVNAGGTFNVLEAARLQREKPLVMYASTNKAYGEIEGAKILEGESRYTFENYPLGISEKQLLDFHSPYGCSKGCGDQYVRDYARIYGISSVVFRQSCIYGKRQFGIEDQGWVAWFVIAAVLGKGLTIYGDGKQVRDLLYVDDLLDAYDLAVEKRKEMKGVIFNIGGGVDNSVAIWKEFGGILEKIHGKKIPIDLKDWRPGDQKVYITDHRKITNMLGWSPGISVKEGISILYNWVSENKALFV